MGYVPLGNITSGGRPEDIPKRCPMDVSQIVLYATPTDVLCRRHEDFLYRRPLEVEK